VYRGCIIERLLCGPNILLAQCFGCCFYGGLIEVYMHVFGLVEHVLLLRRFLLLLRVLIFLAYGLGVVDILALQLLRRRLQCMRP
jgi:hypothetical protein